MKKIAYQMPNGQIALTCGSEAAVRAGETEDQYLSRIRQAAENAIPELKTFTFVGLIDDSFIVNKYNTELSKALAEGKNPVEAHAVAVKEARTRFRKSWKIEAGRIVEDPVTVVVLRWDEIRASRDQLLKDSDILRRISEDTNDGLQAEWKKYQQDLRDITKQSNPDTVVWPVKPESISKKIS